MIRIDLDLFPGGSEDGRENLGHIKIWNDGTGSKTKANYCYRVMKNGRQKAEGRIEKFPRQQRDVFRLLQCVIEDMFPLRAKS